MSAPKSRFKAMLREMPLAVVRASRSAGIETAREVSCPIRTRDHERTTVAHALPIRATSEDLAIRPLTERFDDIAQGDVRIDKQEADSLRLGAMRDRATEPWMGDLRARIGA